MADEGTTVITSAESQQSAPSAVALPDLNLGKYSWDFVQQLVDQAAWFTLLVVPDGRSSAGGLGGITGGTVNASLHRFLVEMQEPSLDSGIRARNVVGPRSGHFRLEWSIISEDAQVRPAQHTVPIVLDPILSQRFVMQEASFTFGEDGFSGFGTGRLFPEFIDGEVRVHAMAVGNITGSAGKFSGLEGTFVLAGQLNESGDFAGSVLVRVVDPNGVLKAAEPIEGFAPDPKVDLQALTPDITYLLYNTAKSGPEQRTTYDIGPQGQIRGIVIPQQYRVARVDFSVGPPGGFQNQIELGADVIGGEVSISAIDPTHPGPPGTADSPATFQGLGTYFFLDQDGNEVGAITPQFLEGRTFAMVLAGAPDQMAARFGCLGPILQGDGYFSGVQGFLVAVSGVALMPHVFNCMQLVYLKDPNRKFLAS